jgi:hypothetical protein
MMFLIMPSPMWHMTLCPFTSSSTREVVFTAGLLDVHAEALLCFAMNTLREAGAEAFLEVDTDGWLADD